MRQSYERHIQRGLKNGASKRQLMPIEAALSWLLLASVEAHAPPELVRLFICYVLVNVTLYRLSSHPVSSVDDDRLHSSRSKTCSW